MSARASRSRRAWAAWASLTALAALAILLASCGGTAPEVALIEWRLERRPSAEGGYESLSAFASIKDEDGIDDVRELWIVNDGAALAWRMNDADWVKRREGSDDWIGAAGLAMQDYSPLPRGEYRLVAVDAAGERVERPFRVSGEFPSTPSPELSWAEGKARVSSSWPETLVLGYDGTGSLIAQAAWTGSAESPPELFGEELGRRVVELAAYGYDPGRKMGAYSWKKKTR